MTESHESNVLPARWQPSRGVDAKSILTIMFRRKAIILAVSLPIIAIATIGTLRSTDVMTASARVMIESKDRSELSYRNVRDDYDEIMATASQIGMSIPVSERAAAVLIDSMRVLAAEDKAFAGEISLDDLRGALLGGVDCSQVGESRILRIAFSDPNAHFALMAAKALTDAFVAYSIEGGRNKNAASYFEEQIAFVHAEIDSLMALRAAILTESGYSTFNYRAQMESNYAGVMDLDYQRAHSRRLALAEKLRGIRAAIAADPEFLPMTEGRQDPLLVGAKSELVDARTKLVELEVRYTDDHVLVIRQKQMVEAALEVLYRERDHAVRELEIQLAEDIQIEDVFASARLDQTEAMAQYPDIERRVASLDLKIDTKRELLKSLQVRRGEVRLEADTDIRISNIIRLDEPSIELAVAGGKKALYLALAAVFAIVFGVVLAVFVENQDHRIYDAAKIESYLEVPVIGSISDTREVRG